MGYYWCIVVASPQCRTHGITMCRSQETERVYAPTNHYLSRAVEPRLCWWSLRRGVSANALWRPVVVSVLPELICLIPVCAAAGGVCCRLAGTAAAPVGRLRRGGGARWVPLWPDVVAQVPAGLRGR